MSEDVPRNPHAIQGPWFNDEFTKAWYPMCNENGAQVVSAEDALCEFIRDSETDILLYGVKVFDHVYLAPHPDSDAYEEEGRMVEVFQSEVCVRDDVVEAWEVGVV